MNPSGNNKKHVLIVLAIILGVSAFVFAIFAFSEKTADITPTLSSSEHSSKEPYSHSPTYSPSHAESNERVSEQTNDWSFTINGIQKRDRFTDVYGGYETPITMKIVNPDSGALILEVSDFTSKNTDLNNLVPSGTEYYLQFYDADGTLMEPVWPNVKTLHN